MGPIKSHPRGAEAGVTQLTGQGLVCLCLALITAQAWQTGRKGSCRKFVSSNQQAPVICEEGFVCSWFPAVNWWGEVFLEKEFVCYPRAHKRDYSHLSLSLLTRQSHGGSDHIWHMLKLSLFLTEQSCLSAPFLSCCFSCTVPVLWSAGPHGSLTPGSACHALSLGWKSDF